MRPRVYVVDRAETIGLRLLMSLALVELAGLVWWLA